MGRHLEDENHTPEAVQQVLALIRAIGAVDREDFVEQQRRREQRSDGSSGGSLASAMTSMSPEQAKERHARIIERWRRNGGPKDHDTRQRVLDWALEAGMLHTHPSGEGVVINPQDSRCSKIALSFVFQTFFFPYV